MGLITDAATKLKNVLGDLFPENAPSQPIAFPTEALNRLRGPIQPIPQQPMMVPPINPEPSKPLGKITSYNWKGDPYSDTNSRNMIGSFGKLTTEGMAVSPDIEKQFKEMGIKPKDKVLLTLADGSTLERRWEDRTMQDKQAIKRFGKPLTGRFDLNYPQGTKPHEKDNIAVVGFKKIASAE